MFSIDYNWSSPPPKKKRENVKISTFFSLFMYFNLQNKNSVFSVLLEIKKVKNKFICDKNVTK